MDYYLILIFTTDCNRSLKGLHFVVYFICPAIYVYFIAEGSFLLLVNLVFVLFFIHVIAMLQSTSGLVILSNLSITNNCMSSW